MIGSFERLELILKLIERAQADVAGHREAYYLADRLLRDATAFE